MILGFVGNRKLRRGTGEMILSLSRGVFRREAFSVISDEASPAIVLGLWREVAISVDRYRLRGESLV